jgi:hypothetical protein
LGSIFTGCGTFTFGLFSLELGGCISATAAIESILGSAAAIMGLTFTITISKWGAIFGSIVLIGIGLCFVGKDIYLYFESWIFGNKLINVP